MRLSPPCITHLTHSRHVVSCDSISAHAPSHRQHVSATPAAICLRSFAWQPLQICNRPSASRHMAHLSCSICHKGGRHVAWGQLLSSTDRMRCGAMVSMHRIRLASLLPPPVGCPNLRMPALLFFPVFPFYAGRSWQP